MAVRPETEINKAVNEVHARSLLAVASVGDLVWRPESETGRLTSHASASQLQEVSSEDDEPSQQEDKDSEINADILQSYHHLQTVAESQLRSFKGRITSQMLYLPRRQSSPQPPSTPVALEEGVKGQKLRIYAVTWNMHGKLPTEMGRLLPVHPAPHIYVVASQECMRSISKSLVVQSKEQWETRLARTLGSDYVMLRSHTMVAIHLAVFIHTSLQPIVSAIRSADIGTGWAKQGNKGAVAVSCQVGATSLLCVCCHLTSGQNSIKRRNLDFDRINRELRLNEETGPLTESFDAVVWLGDLNYRINGPKASVEMLIAQGQLGVLLESDQLGLERRHARLPGDLLEGEIRFQPTYRFDHGTDTYDTSRKQRVPSWCDRILYRSRKNGLKLVQYSSLMDLRLSDHKPVFAHFELTFVTAESEVAAEPLSQSKKSSVCLVF